MKNVFVFCPSYLVSGGPDALHQIVYYLRKINIQAHIVYVDLKKKIYKIPEQYRGYIDNGEYKLINEIVDESESVLICPETYTFLLDKFKHAQKYIWWLSVNNDTERSGAFDKLKILFKKLSPRQIVKQLKKKNKWLNFRYFLKHKKFDFNTADKRIVHLCASYYAYDYVQRHDVAKQYLCIEPISKFFLENIGVNTENDRSNTVIYNPAKNLKFTKKLIHYCKDITFLALKGYTQNELLALYRKSKLYIDFGTFPGAERIPKEAVINGCCIITGLNGASANYNDVPIPQTYKIASKKDNMQQIKEQILLALTNYKSCYSDFEEYRKTVMNLEDNFKKQLSAIFWSANANEV